MKYLVLEYLFGNKKIVTFKVKEQSHKCNEFGVNNFRFKASNGILMASETCPEDGFDVKWLFVRGDDTKKDHDDITVTIEKWKQIKQAVKEYNIYFGYIGQSIIGEEPEQLIPKEMFILD